MKTVSLIRGENRRENTLKSLELLRDEIKEGITRRQVIIKPNFVSTSIQLASSHVDQIRGILDFLKGFYKGRVLLAEGATLGETEEGFKNFGYHSLIDEYDVEFLDLNKSPYELIALRNSQGRSFNVKVSRVLLDKENYLISAARLKTHDTVVVTLSIKNIAMGSVLLPDKIKVHQGYKNTNLNITALAQSLWPDLALIDGLVGMEGDGPILGEPIDVGVAIASTDPLAADRVGSEVMGVDFSKIGYLNQLADRGLGEGDMKKINIRGEALKDCVRPFRLHSYVEEQYKWADR
ncbi:MAG: DUF362 domain-containing protein [Thermodesulfobacteriota bacterium]